MIELGGVARVALFAHTGCLLVRAFSIGACVGTCRPK